MQVSQQGVAQSNKLWNANAVITVRFLNDPYNMKEFVMTHAREWEKHTCVRFELVESGEADVRVAFNWNNNRRITWSYTGNDCRKITDQSKPTMNIAGWQSASKTEEAKKGDVLRAFGQVMGLEYEYRHLAHDPMWNEDEFEIEDYWMFQQNLVSWAEFKQYVYDPLQAYKTLQTESYDPQSIMVVPLPDYVAGNTGRSFNTQLSATDIAFIQQLYPLSSCMGSPIITMKTKKQDVLLAIKINGRMIIDWGDGKIDVYDNPYYKSISHNTGSSYNPDVVSKLPQHKYTNSLENTIKIYGDGDEVTVIDVYNNELTFLDVSQCHNLMFLDCFASKLQNLDISMLSKLQKITITGNYIKNIDLSQNIELREFVALNTPLESINVNTNKKLTYLTLSDSKINSLYLNNLPELYSTYCTNSKQLTKTEITNCTKLNSIYIARNPVIDELTLADVPNLSQVHFYETSILYNQNLALNLVNQLPHKSINRPGDLSTRHHMSSEPPVQPFTSWVTAICEAKNWDISK